MSKIYEALKQAEQERAAGQREVAGDTPAPPSEQDALTAAVDKSREAMSALAAQIASGFEDRAQVLTLQQALNSDLEALRGDLTALRADLERLQAADAREQQAARIDQLEKHFGDTNSALRTLDEALKVRDRRMDGVLETLSAVEQRMGEALSNLIRERDQVMAEIASVNATAGSDWNGLQERIAAIEAQGQGANQRLDRTAESFAAAVGTLHARVDTLEERIAERIEATARDVANTAAAGHAYQAEQQELFVNLRQNLESKLAALSDTVTEQQRRAAVALEQLKRIDESEEHLADLSTAVARAGEEQRAAAVTVQQQIDTLATEKAALRQAVAAQARQVAEAMQLHRASLTSAVEAQIEPVRAALQEAVARLEGEIATIRLRTPISRESASVQIVGASSATRSGAPPSGMSPQENRHERPRAAIGLWRGPLKVGALVSLLLLFGVVLLSRSMGARKNARAAVDVSAASFAGLQDPLLAERFASGLKALQRGEFAVAEHAFREVVAARPGCVEARNNLAVALDEQQHREAAAEQLREALRIRPGYDRARKNLERLETGEGALSGDSEMGDSRRDG
ncbi:MAG TPA: tetratricopeptide repeat protein [Candidatus Acidoferrales bacterium]|nr:tetratricopeptide repeat protein [Candidatus Acidoferrales bacterium]